MSDVVSLIVRKLRVMDDAGLRSRGFESFQ